MEFFPLDGIEQILISINTFLGAGYHNLSASLAETSYQMGAF